MTDSTFIGTLPRNSRDEIRVELTEYQGHNFVSVRTYTQMNGEGEHRPTKKGITAKPDQIRSLIELLEQAETMANNKGLISRHGQ